MYNNNLIYKGALEGGVNYHKYINYKLIFYIESIIQI